MRFTLQLSVLVLSVLLLPLTYFSCESPKTGVPVVPDTLGSVLTLFTYHGPVEVSPEEMQLNVILHVLVKAKRRADGSFALRTVSYAERPELKGERGQRIALYFSLPA